MNAQPHDFYLHDFHLLRLLHLADSALPIGAAAHSFGLETLTQRGYLTVAGLEEFLRAHLAEAGALEAAFCGQGYGLASADPSGFAEEWLAQNRLCAACKPGRESREASAVLGRRLLQLALSVEPEARLRTAWETARAVPAPLHHPCVFGLVAGAFGLGKPPAVQAYLHQSVAGLLAACQKLLPLGQGKATEILWALKGDIVAVAGTAGDADAEDVWMTAPLLDWGAMAHASLPGRLFVS